MNPTTAPPKFMTGAIPSPRRKLLAATPHVATAPAPPQFAVVPPKMSVEGNDRYGDCVSAEEAWAKAWYSLYCGLPELYVPDQVTIDWARRHGFLNGADLSSVMDAMAREGMVVGGVEYKDGPYSSVDYGTEATVQSALTVGPVKIAIDASALPSGAGNGNGWYAVNGGRYRNTDHCVGLGGYGPAGWLYTKLGVPLPSGLQATQPGYLLYTWGTMGFVSQDWLDGTCTEAWVRGPTTPGQTPTPAVLDWSHIL